ncbi:MAG: hypothetical protein HY742_02815 [Deltaproteobacteria bacterium]|nr:hypothetical protein [Deltaproteobacteria bacterium]
MERQKRRLLINWSNTHRDLKWLIENNEPYESKIGNNKGWSYITFFPKDVRANKMLYDINRLLEVAKDNSYYLPREVVIQHNKVVLTAYPDGKSLISPLVGLYHLVTSYVDQFSDIRKYPAHGFYGKLGGIYERPEKGRVLALYSRNDNALLDIYESLDHLISEAALEGIQFKLRFSNGLSAIPRMLHGFDDPEYNRSGGGHYKITDPDRFTVLLNQARHDYERYPFDEAGAVGEN